MMHVLYTRHIVDVGFIVAVFHLALVFGVGAEPNATWFWVYLAIGSVAALGKALGTVARWQLRRIERREQMP